uniref:Uncharacterized protein n=1 Tax=Aegilops tauschii subsp. strangulata TaxID=200361 RepID=A0A453CLH9_AEGTS
MSGAEPSSAAAGAGAGAGNGQHAAVDIRAAAQQPEEPRQTSMSGPLNLRSDRRPPPAQRAFSRQVSLGSGVAVMGMDRGGRNGGRPGQRALPRSGKSLGVLNHSGGLGPDGAARRGGDFSMFRTKSTLSKQNSMLPSRIKEELDGVDLDHAEGQPAGRPADVDPLNKSVPAGRYFAALRGPELDEVRVRLRGHPAAQGRGVAVPAAVPDRLLRGLPGARQPGHPVGRAGGEPGDGVPPGDADDQRRRVAAGDGGAGGHVRHLRAQVRLLLRGHPARVLPPGARQLLLHAVHRRHVPRHRPPPRLRAGEAAPGRVVRVRGAAVRAGAQDLRAVAVGRQAEAVQGGQPVVAPLRGGQLRGRHPGGEGRVGGGRQVPVGHRRLPLHRRLRHALPAAAHQRGAAHGAAPCLLHVHRHAVRRQPRLGGHLRQLRRRRAHLLLHGALPLHVPRRAHQLLPWLPVLHRVVVVHVPHDDGVAGHRQVRRGRAVLHEQSPGAEPLPHVDDHGVAAARVDAPACFLLALAVPQRPRHRHHQGPAERRGEATRQGEEGRQEGERHQAVGQAGAALGRLLHHQEQLCRQGRRGENRL